MARNSWCVIPAEGEWLVRPKNAEEPLERFSSKEAAVARAQEIAQAHRPSDVMVQDAGAEFRVEAAYD